MIADWPETLPIPNRLNFQQGRQEARLKTTNDAGPPRYRLMSSAIVDPIQLTITVDRNGKEIFDTFYQVTTARGSLPFWMPDPTTDGWQMQDETAETMLDENGEPLLFSEQWLCMFGDTPPAAAITGLRFDISFTIGIMP